MPSLKTKDLRRVRGETIKLRMTVHDETGAVVDLTGATIHLRVRPDLKAGAVITKSSPSTGIAISTQTGTTKGQYVATIAAADTASLEPGDYVWDSWVITSGAERYAVVAPSKLTLLHEVSTLP
jgi:hypothetical protein